MNEEQYKKARILQSNISDIEIALDELPNERNYLALPQEMYDRHIAEKRTFLENELARMKTAFAAI